MLNSQPSTRKSLGTEQTERQTPPARSTKTKKHLMSSLDSSTAIVEAEEKAKVKVEASSRSKQVVSKAAISVS